MMHNMWTGMVIWWAAGVLSIVVLLIVIGKLLKK